MPADRLVAVLLLQTLAAIPQAGPGPHYIQSCDPCSVVLRNGSPPADFHFKVERAQQGRVVRAIVFERADHTVQELNVPSMTPLAEDESFFFGGQDINFDGWLDLLLMTQHGAANSKARYWIYDPAVDRFRDLGEFPIFHVDARHRLLTTSVVNGPAGLVYEKRDYAFDDSNLIVMREETQEASPSRPGSYVHTVRQRKDGKLVVVLRKMFKQPVAP